MCMVVLASVHVENSRQCEEGQVSIMAQDAISKLLYQDLVLNMVVEMKQ